MFYNVVSTLGSVAIKAWAGDWNTLIESWSEIRIAQTLAYDSHLY